MDWEIVASDLRFPEGPTVLPDGSIVVVEIAARQITRIARDGTKRVIARTGGSPNGAALGPDGRLIVCNSGGFEFHDTVNGLMPGHQPADYEGGSIQVVDLATGSVETLYDRAGDLRLVGPNDLVMDTDGGFWFTDQGKTRPRERDRAGVFYAKADGSHIAEAIFPTENTNGIGLSPDGTTLYVVESYTCMLWAFDLDGPGRIRPSDCRFGAMMGHGGRFLYRPAGFKLFDSLAVDDAGNICIGTLGDAGITVVSPEGEELAFLPTDDMMPTNICFADAGRTAFVTLSATGKLAKTSWPAGGPRTTNGRNA